MELIPLEVGSMMYMVDYTIQIFELWRMQMPCSLDNIFIKVRFRKMRFCGRNI